MHLTRKLKIDLKITHKLFALVAFILCRIHPSTAIRVRRNPDHWLHQQVDQSRCSCGIPGMSDLVPDI